jgi:urease accessory protein
MRNSTDKILFAFMLLTLSGTAFAHPGHQVSGFAAGLMHPFSGLDHLLAMVAVGLWAAQSDRKNQSSKINKGDKHKIWLLPATFMTTLVIGAAVATQWRSLPLVEAGIATSVLALGLLIALSLQLPITLSIVVTGLFGLLHGYAHGLALPASTSPIAYALGFLFATAALHLGGIATGVATRKRYELLAKMLGLAITASGIYLLSSV